MTPTVWIAILVYPALALLLQVAVPRRSTLIGSIIVGWLFLPNFRYDVPALPDLTKEQLVGLVTMVLLVVMHPKALMRVRWHPVDAFVAIWCLCPLFSALSNGDGAYAGFSGVYSSLLIWAAPYLAGRALIREPADIRQLARLVVIGGLIYVPFCLYEVRMSPQLHTELYGYFQHSFSQTRRFGGWRPVVFLQHGLAVGLWISVAATVASALAVESRGERISSVPMGLVAVALVTTAILVKSAGAIVLLALALGAILVRRVTGVRIALVIGLITVPTYLAVRIGTDWTGQGVIDPIAEFSEQHAGSLEMRLVMDRRLADHAMRRPFFGWGGFGRALQIGDEDAGKVLLDTLWIYSFSTQGFTGLVSLFGALVLPLAVVLTTGRRGPPPDRATGAALHGLSLALLIFCLDSLMNGMINPVYLVIGGGLLTFATRAPLRAAASRRAPSPAAEARPAFEGPEP